MGGRRHVGIARARHGEAQRVADASRTERRLFVTRQPGEDRQAGCVGARPAGLTAWAHGVAVELEERAAICVPAAAISLQEGAIQLVESVVVTVDHQHVPVAIRAGAPFDGRRGRHGVGPGVALVAIGRPGDRHRRLGARHHHVGNAQRRTVVQPGAEVRMQASGGADAGDDGVRVRVDGIGRDVSVPGIARWEGDRTVQRGTRAQSRGAEIAVGRGPWRRRRPRRGCRRWPGRWRR